MVWNHWELLFSAGVKPIPNPGNGGDQDGDIRLYLNFFSQALDVDIQSSGVGIKLGVPPDLFFDKGSGQTFIRVGEKEFKQLKFGFGQFYGLVCHGDLAGSMVDFQVLHLFFILDHTPVKPAEHGGYSGRQF